MKAWTQHPGWMALMLLLGCLCLAQSATPQQAIYVDPFPFRVRQLRPSVVAIGSYHFKDTPTAAYFGTGFVVDDGRAVITNHHVVEMIREAKRIEHLRIFFPDDDQVQGRPGRLIVSDPIHDLALIRFEGAPVAAVTIDDQREPMQGQAVGVLGYPIGMILGVVPAAHKGVVAAVVRAVRPLPAGSRMKPHLIRALREPYNLYQLDMVVLPGNSGSPLFDANTGHVIGVVNKTLAAKTREHLIESPSGIAYAVPSVWVSRLIQQSKQMSSATEDPDSAISMAEGD